MWVYPTLVHGYRHFAATTKEKGATFSRNPLFYLVGWRSLNKLLNALNIKDFSVFNFQLCT